MTTPCFEFTPDEIAFTKVKLPFGWMSNMSPHSIAFHEELGPGMAGTWPTAEHLFQALRFPTDHPIRQELQQIASPMAAKMYAKKHTALMVVEPRSDTDVMTMRMVLACKLEENPALKDLLLATGERRIIENCSARASESGLFWGARRCSSPDDDQAGQWQGHNTLGELWMAARWTLRYRLEQEEPEQP